MELIAILALVLALVAGFKLLDWGIQMLEPHTGSLEGALPFVAFLVIFILVVVLVNLGGRMLKRVLDLTLLGSIDNLAGAVVGVLKWAFLLSVLFWLLDAASMAPDADQMEGTVLYPVVASFAPWLVMQLGYLLPFAQDLFDSIKELIAPAQEGGTQDPGVITS